MKMSDIPGRIVRPLGELKRGRSTSPQRSELVEQADKLKVGEYLVVPANRSGYGTRLSRKLPGKAFQQRKVEGELRLYRLPNGPTPQPKSLMDQIPVFVPKK